MLLGISMLAAWVAVWVGATMGIGKYTSSKILSVGGGFLAGAVAVAVVATILNPTPKESEQPAPRISSSGSAQSQAEREERRQQRAEERAERDAVCIKDIECWGNKHNATAGFACKEPVEKLGKFTHKWTDGAFGMKFSRFRWLDRDRGTLTYLGDKIEFQNAFGAWQPHVYECDLEPISRTVLAVRATPGRL